MTDHNNIYTEIKVDGYERVVKCENDYLGLKAWIAVHNTKLGPSLGGCRMWTYENEDAALTDVLRLSKGMTYKSALAGLELGGGKAVIWGDAKTQKTPGLLKAMAEFVEHLGGIYIIAEDIGTTVKDMIVMREFTEHVVSPLGGDPGPWTAKGCYVGIRAAMKHKFGDSSLKDRSILIQGVGSVGFHLGEMLADAGAELMVSDINVEAISRASKAFHPYVASQTNDFAEFVDVFSPCALGAGINETTVNKIKAPIVAGSANNQLLSPNYGEMLRKRGILYAPDKVINSGGVIQVAGGLSDTFDEELVLKKIAGIGPILTEIFERSDREKVATNYIANDLAEEILGIK